jgi:hypothetical protein
MLGWVDNNTFLLCNAANKLSQVIEDEEERPTSPLLYKDDVISPPLSPLSWDSPEPASPPDFEFEDEDGLDDRLPPPPFLSRWMCVYDLDDGNDETNQKATSSHRPLHEGCHGLILPLVQHWFAPCAAEEVPFSSPRSSFTKTCLEQEDSDSSQHKTSTPTSPRSSLHMLNDSDFFVQHASEENIEAIYLSVC